MRWWEGGIGGRKGEKGKKRREGDEVRCVVEKMDNYWVGVVR